MRLQTNVDMGNSFLIYDSEYFCSKKYLVIMKNKYDLTTRIKLISYIK